jgi:hypothetical protein
MPILPIAMDLPEYNWVMEDNQVVSSVLEEFVDLYLHPMDYKCQLQVISKA